MEKERKAPLLWEAASQERKTEDDRQRNGEREGGREGKSSDGAGERERHRFSKMAKIKLQPKKKRLRETKKVETETGVKQRTGDAINIYQQRLLQYNRALD